LTREFDDAIERARGHLRNASLEGLEAARALVDAASVASGAVEIAPDSLTGQIRSALGELIDALRNGRGFDLPAALTQPLSDALEAEIARWQRRSRIDPDARPVLRAFLGLRELLWELGFERPERGPEDAETREDPVTAPSKGKPDTPPATRVQRFEVEH
jgi:hypothetical protein